MQRSAIWLAAALSTFAGEFARPQAARACSVPRDSITVRDTPVNAAVIVDVSCWLGPCVEGGLPTELEVVDLTTGLPIPGAIVHSAHSADGHSQALMAWKPEAELVEGRSYRVAWPAELPSTYTDLDNEFLALPAIDGDAARANVVVALELRVDDYYARTSCELEPSSGMCSNSHAIGLVSKSYASLEAGVDADELLAAQLVVHTAFWAQGEPMPNAQLLSAYRYGSLATSKRFDVAESAYCYRISIESLIDGSTAAHEDCLAHGSLGVLEETPVPQSQLQAQMRQCAMPPEGDYLELWCTARLEQCTADQDVAPSCASARTMCAEIVVDEPEPTEPNDPGEPNVPMDPNEPQDPPAQPNQPDDDGLPGAAGMSGAMTGDDTELRSACSASPGAHRSTTLGALLASLGLVLFARRRR